MKYCNTPICQNAPLAAALVFGNQEHPRLKGAVRFYQATERGILIEAEFFHLPKSDESDIPMFFGFHIHENGDCSDNFANTGSHYNPQNQIHPYHAGDLPSLLSNRGYAWTVFFDSYLTIPEIIGKSVVVHELADDFSTQPSGNSGTKIACGVIQPWKESGI
jgi:Cu/Zn superoxide dismutase